MRFCYWAFLLDHRSQGLYLKFWWAMSWTWSTSTPYFCPFTWGHNKTGTEKSTRSFPYCRMGSAGDSSAGALKSSLFLVCSLQLTSVHSFFFFLYCLFSQLLTFFFFCKCLWAVFLCSFPPSQCTTQRATRSCGRGFLSSWLEQASCLQHTVTPTCSSAVLVACCPTHLATAGSFCSGGELCLSLWCGFCFFSMLFF